MKPRCFRFSYNETTLSALLQPKNNACDRVCANTVVNIDSIVGGGGGGLGLGFREAGLKRGGGSGGTGWEGEGGGRGREGEGKGAEKILIFQALVFRKRRGRDLPPALRSPL